MGMQQPDDEEDVNDPNMDGGGDQQGKDLAVQSLIAHLGYSGDGNENDPQKGDENDDTLSSNLGADMSALAKRQKGASGGGGGGGGKGGSSGGGMGGMMGGGGGGGGGGGMDMSSIMGMFGG